jgi:hypothetical protein
VVASAFAAAKIGRSAHVDSVRTYYRIQATYDDNASVTALIGVNLSARAVDFDGLAWCEGAVLFEMIGSFSLDAIPIRRRLEAELAQHLRALIREPLDAAGAPRPGSRRDGGSRRRRR